MRLPSLEAVKFAMDWCTANGIALGGIVGGTPKDGNRVRWRRKLAVAMDSKGYSFPEIGYALNMDHSSIYPMVQSARRKKGLPGAEKT